MFNSETEKHLTQTSHFLAVSMWIFGGCMPHSRPKTRKKMIRRPLLLVPGHPDAIFHKLKLCLLRFYWFGPKKNPRLGHTKNLLRQCLLTLDKQGIGITCKRSSTKSLKMVTLWPWWCYGFIPCIPWKQNVWVSKSNHGNSIEIWNW